MGSQGKPFVLVGVLRTEGPTAIKAGSKAIIFPDGSIEGWVGGHCTESEIVSAALSCLKDGATRYLNLTTCQGGKMDVYLEPSLPTRKLVVFGHVPIVSSLCRFAKTLGFKTTVVDRSATREKFPDADSVVKTFDEVLPMEDPKNTYAVVATMGDSDQEHVEKLLRYGIAYIGVVAGRKRAQELFSLLATKKLFDDENSTNIKSPAGIDIHAVTAEEIALSIIAEIVQKARGASDQSSKILQLQESNASFSEVEELRKGSKKEEEEAEGEGEHNRALDAKEVFVDPICGMTVSSSSNYYARAGSEIVYFCSESCKDSFIAKISADLTESERSK